MRIYGYKLKEKVMHLDYLTEDDTDIIPICPEDDICEACHLYSDNYGHTYVGFDLSLGMPQTDMDAFLDFVPKEKRKIYKVVLN